MLYRKSQPFDSPRTRHASRTPTDTTGDEQPVAPVLLDKATTHLPAVGGWGHRKVSPLLDVDSIVLKAVDEAILYRTIVRPNSDATMADAVREIRLVIRDLRRYERVGYVWVIPECFVGNYAYITNTGERVIQDDPRDGCIGTFGTNKAKMGAFRTATLNDSASFDE